MIFEQLKLSGCKGYSMKKNYLAVVVATLAFSLAACDSKSDTSKGTDQPAAGTNSTAAAQNSTTEASGEMKDVSYSIGYQFGKNLTVTRIKSFDSNEIAAGLNDALAGKDSKLSKEQMQIAMTALEAEVQKATAEEAREYEEKGKAFLEENAKRDGVITTESGLQYEVVTKGTGAKPGAEDIVKVNYEGKLVDGKVFDSSIQRGEPVEFAVNTVIPGWVEALQLMQVGEKIKLYIPSDLAYGASGVPPVIPPNSVLVFDVELLDIKKPDDKADAAETAADSK